MQFAALGAIARLKLLLTARHYRRQWGNACVLVAAMFIVILAAVAGGALLFAYCHGPEVSSRDNAFAWAAWIMAAMWLISPALQFDAQRQLDLGGMRLVPLSTATFTGAVFLDGILSPLGVLFVPILLCCWVCFSRGTGEIAFAGLSLLLLMSCLVGLGQAVYIWAGRLLSSRRFTDAAFIAGAVVFVLLQSMNIFIHSGSDIDLPAWMVQTGVFLKMAAGPLAAWLFPGLSWRALEAVSAGDTASAAGLYLLMTVQAGACIWLAGLASRQYHSGELESGGTAPRAPEIKGRHLGAGWLKGQIGALVHRERLYLMRDPVLKRLLFQTMIGVLYFAAMLVLMGFRRAGMPGGFREILSTYGLLGMSIMLAGMESSMLFNKFGYDGPLLVNQLLAPVDRRRILISKSLFLLIHFGSVNLLFVIALAIALKSPLLYAVTAALMVCANTAVIDIIGNFVSIYYPFTYRRKGSRMKAVMPQPGCGYVFVYSLVWQACNLAVLPASAALALGVIYGGAWGLMLGAVFAAAVVYTGYRYGIPLAARILQERESQLIQALAPATD